MAKKSADKFCHPNLIKERSSCRFNQEEITYIFDDGEEKTKLKRQLCK